MSVSVNSTIPSASVPTISRQGAATPSRAHAVQAPVVRLASGSSTHGGSFQAPPGVLRERNGPAVSAGPSTPKPTVGSRTIPALPAPGMSASAVSASSKVVQAIAAAQGSQTKQPSASPAAKSRLVGRAQAALPGRSISPPPGPTLRARPAVAISAPARSPRADWLLQNQGWQTNSVAPAATVASPAPAPTAPAAPAALAASTATTAPTLWMTPPPSAFSPSADRVALTQEVISVAEDVVARDLGPDAIGAVLPYLRDSNEQVRLWAVDVIAEIVHRLRKTTTPKTPARWNAVPDADSTKPVRTVLATPMATATSRPAEQSCNDLVVRSPSPLIVASSASNYTHCAAPVANSKPPRSPSASPSLAGTNVAFNFTDLRVPQADTRQIRQGGASFTMPVPVCSTGTPSVRSTISWTSAVERAKSTELRHRAATLRSQSADRAPMKAKSPVSPPVRAVPPLAGPLTGTVGSVSGSSPRSDVTAAPPGWTQRGEAPQHPPCSIGSAPIAASEALVGGGYKPTMPTHLESRSRSAIHAARSEDSSGSRTTIPALRLEEVCGSRSTIHEARPEDGGGSSSCTVPAARFEESCGGTFAPAARLEEVGGGRLVPAARQEEAGGSRSAVLAARVEEVAESRNIIPAARPEDVCGSRTIIPPVRAEDSCSSRSTIHARPEDICSSRSIFHAAWPQDGAGNRGIVTAVRPMDVCGIRSTIHARPDDSSGTRSTIHTVRSDDVCIDITHWRVKSPAVTTSPGACPSSSVLQVDEQKAQIQDSTGDAKVLKHKSCFLSVASASSSSGCNGEQKVVGVGMAESSHFAVSVP